MTAATDHEPLIARAWDVAEHHRLTGDHPLVRAIWALEDAIDHNTTDPGHAAQRVEALIGELP
ncbi:hypothetical protein GII30_02470 [Gordonia amarae]|uniref:Uncharacterized protein n=2 Tax=Gordonia amarae TaxID=36821 RepID=G7GN21_9ACTN|nr:hypothetical protein [Gordonia amarae]QHN16024.1 hypothetical protein GII35_02625 [Gordonia amarae]QHN24115.1 hypothetical protein GII34_02625 [Gordonia amarae]QHN33031.1 hypothetical protein GII32_02630 [Gordonia amarae]QHN41751.1 hypothetical protein GII30_02470 [Gordonia amarae]GAB04996.1 hypothetical protein GOAMR_25_00330 [Gordonia amarae NBRC 15530]